jgi:hypothetical protein
MTRISLPGLDSADCAFEVLEVHELVACESTRPCVDGISIIGPGNGSVRDRYPAGSIDGTMTGAEPVNVRVDAARGRESRRGAGCLRSARSSPAL